MGPRLASVPIATGSCGMMLMWPGPLSINTIKIIPIGRPKGQFDPGNFSAEFLAQVTLGCVKMTAEASMDNSSMPKGSCERKCLTRATRHLTVFILWKRAGAVTFFKAGGVLLYS